MAKDTIVGAIDCVHHKCIKSRLLGFEFGKELFVYPRLRLEQDIIYEAHCYMVLDDEVQSETETEVNKRLDRFLEISEIGKNIEYSYQLFDKVVCFNLVVSEGSRGKEEESLIYALCNICALDQASIKLVHVYKDRLSGSYREVVYFEEQLAYLDYDRLVGRLQKIGEGTYEIIRPENRNDFETDHSKELDQLGTPTKTIPLIKKRLKNKTGLSDHELNVLALIQWQKKRTFRGAPKAVRPAKARISKYSFSVPDDMLVNISRHNYELLREMLSNSAIREILSDPILKDYGGMEQLEKLSLKFKDSLDALGEK